MRCSERVVIFAVDSSVGRVAEPGSMGSQK